MPDVFDARLDPLEAMIRRLDRDAARGESVDVGRP
jgi:hypothetical protein